MDVAEPSDSDWSSPCLLVPKAEDRWRFVTDYRKLNSVTKADAYPIPRIDDLIDQIGNSKYVSKFDLTKGYWQVHLSQRAREISAFITPDGLFQYKRMAFGMKNSAATFQRLMNRVIKGLVCSIVYIDDIVLYSDAWDCHIQQIRALFERLTEANLTVNLVKSEFGKATVIYLGYVVGQGQVKPVTAKVKAIIDFSAPSDRKSLLRFLGMAGYYRKFCTNFAAVTSVLTDLLKKDVPFLWSKDCHHAFENVKSMLCNKPVLAAPDFQRPFTLTVDASDVGAGAVLSQDDDSGIDHPVAYFSRKFGAAQKNYSTVEKECLSLVMAVEHFDIYLSMPLHPVTVYTDHNPLVFLSRMKNSNRRLMKWSLKLQEYNLQIKHIRGHYNVIADAISRAR